MPTTPKDDTLRLQLVSSSGQRVEVRLDGCVRNATGMDLFVAVARAVLRLREAEKLEVSGG